MVDDECRGAAKRFTRSTGGRRILALGVAAALTASVAGCTSAHTDADTATTHHHAAHSAAPTSTETPGTATVVTPSPTASPVTPSPSAAPANPAVSHLATPDPVAKPLPKPYVAAIPAGTVVAQGSVASPKGSIHFAYRMVADGDGTFSAQYSGYTSTLPVPVSVTLLSIPPHVGDGLTSHGVGDHLLGGPTTGAAPLSTASIGGGLPSYLVSLVTYSSAASTSGLPTEIGPNKVLAVNTVAWSIPARQTNVHPVDGGSRAFATGTVTAKTASGAPGSYRVAPGDTTAVVAQRFGITTEDLIWLNANLEVFGAQQYLYEGTTLNLDPQAL